MVLGTYYAYITTHDIVQVAHDNTAPLINHMFNIWTKVAPKQGNASLITEAILSKSLFPTVA